MLLILYMSLTEQEQLEALLKKKGIGPAGSKSLIQGEIDLLADLFLSNDVSLTTKTTMLTALLTLEPTAIEEAFIHEVKNNPTNYLPSELAVFVNGCSEDSFTRLILQTIAKEDLSQQECEVAMSSFFGDAPDYLQAAFLEAQRLKRETFTENKTFFDAFWQQCDRLRVDLPVVVDICTNYDGSVRTKNYSLFTAQLLALYGTATLVHGVDAVAPKEGTSLHGQMKALGKNSLQSLEKCKEQLLSDKWAYVDQKVFFPVLHQKKALRKEMVKRPFIATFEKLLQPLRNEGGNYQVTGYTHKHYKQEVPKLLKELGKCAKALVVKGEEGSAQLPLHKASEYVVYNGDQLIEGEISPADFKLSVPKYKDITPHSAEDVVFAVKQAISGNNEFVKKQIVYNAAVYLTVLGLASSKGLIEKLMELFDQLKVD
ncbi:MAG: anthranilate phosphoribosyltransferase [Cyclobacteriaceae bacterium]